MKHILRSAIAVAVLATATTLLLPSARAQDPAASKSSEAFEQRFLEMMTHHHRGGVEMASLCQSKAQHQELKPFCTQLAGSQQKEADQMQAPRWVYAFAIVILALVLLFLMRHLAGGGFGGHGAHSAIAR